MKKKMITLVLAVMLILGLTVGPAAVASAATTYTNNIYNVTTYSSDNVANFRTGPGMEYGVITPLSNGTTLRVTAVSKNYNDGLVWGQAVYNGTTGWVSMLLTNVYDMETASVASYDVTVRQQENLYLRKGPGTEYEELARPKNGQVLRIDRTMVNSWDGRPWGRTTYNGVQGWVSLDWTSRNSSATYNWAQDVTFYNNNYYGVVGSSDGFVNLRSGAGLGYSILTPIYNGNEVFITATLKNSSDGLVWAYTNFNGYAGWFSIDQTTITSMPCASTAQYNVVVQNSDNLKLRRGPGAEHYQLVGYIPNGTVLSISQTMINSFDGRPWGRTTFNGYTGWISLDWTYRQ